jgi:hypothetical protein
MMIDISGKLWEDVIKVKYGTMFIIMNNTAGIQLKLACEIM